MAEENAITQQLVALVRLQYLDTRIDQTEKLRGDLPDEIRDLEDERVGLETRIDKFKQEQKESEVERKRAEMEKIESESLIERYEKQQNMVRNNREYDALTKEVEVQRQRIIDAIQRTENLLARDEGNQAALEEVESRLRELNELIAFKTRELDTVLEETRQEREQLEAERDKASEEIDPRYLRAYQRLRDRMRDGRAVVPVIRGAAGGFAVPPQRQVELRQRNRVIVDEHTGRILVDEDLYNDTISEIEQAAVK